MQTNSHKQKTIRTKARKAWHEEARKESAKDAQRKEQNNKRENVE